jgi:hypothetical protein
MNTYIVTPPSDAGKSFEVKAYTHWTVDGGKTIVFVDDKSHTVATYIAHPGTLVQQK